MNNFIFSSSSKQNLIECRSELVVIAYEGLRLSDIDFKITCGYRNEKDQEEAFKNNKSHLHYPDSKHNKIPSKAFDFHPVPINFLNINKYLKIIDVFKEIAFKLDVKLRFGADWADYGHVELLD